MMPELTSCVVAVLCDVTTRRSSMRTASVFVPPTSIPILSKETCEDMGVLP
jgi:hypothetical protein